ncbi:hypothetical protein [Solilutibacter silvestris]|uniref:Beta-barrel assembly machine subunit BamC n=1 Tax=Solilutibacter silvestris TaxID=1645665 RepID=A0A2K1PYV7_9GAMM|nr:hypothetical protein [Lysobacter silvestris]PNS07973.1 hypothetical protein Lysil_2149 [Lysobacter silvestris]
MQVRTRLAVAALAVAALSTSGCSWFHGKQHTTEAYKLAAESRPLEVPPDLDRPSADASINIPSGSSSVSASQVQRGGSTTTPAPRESANAFIVPGTRDDVFGKLGTALAGVPGVTVNNKSQLLGTYDVTASGHGFLVRTTAVDGGVHVSSIDPRGSLDTSIEATKVIAALKAALAK